MHPNSKARRVHSAEFKAQVLQACRQPDASVAGVALSHGLNVNLVRKWLVGRGVKRAGLTIGSAPVASLRADSPVTPPTASAGLQFVPVSLATSEPQDGADARETTPSPTSGEIHIELRRGAARLTVRWPSSHSSACAAWLREITAALK